MKKTIIILHEISLANKVPCGVDHSSVRESTLDGAVMGSNPIGRGGCHESTLNMK